MSTSRFLKKVQNTHEIKKNHLMVQCSGTRRENVTEPLVIQIQVFRLFYFWHLFKNDGGRKFMVNRCWENSKRVA